MIRIAILDDYQNIALELADWASLGDRVEVTVFNDHVGNFRPGAAWVGGRRTDGNPPSGGGNSALTQGHGCACQNNGDCADKSINIGLLLLGTRSVHELQHHTERV